MLETKVAFWESLSSSNAGMLSIDSVGIPATRFPRDCREDPLLICLIYYHLSKTQLLMWYMHKKVEIINQPYWTKCRTLLGRCFQVLNISHNEALLSYLESWGNDGLDDCGGLLLVPSADWAQGWQRGNQHRRWNWRDLAVGQACTDTAQGHKCLCRDGLNVGCQRSRYL